jgi:HK97 family phage prohead protease
MERILKTINFEIKDIDETDASFWAIASDSAIDRDGDIILQDGWDLKAYKRNPTIPLFHNYHEFPVAKAAKVKVQDGKLMFKPTFAVNENPQAKIAFDLYKGGFMNAFSVGFLPIEFEEETRKDGRIGRNYSKIELLEISAVLVPSNPNALAEARSKGINVDGLEDEEREGDTEEKTDIDGITAKPVDVTENYIRIRVKNPDLFAEGSFRTIDISKKDGIKAVIGKLKSDPEGSTVVQVYLFDKEKWTVDEAKKWVETHKDSLDYYIDLTITFCEELKHEMAQEFAKVYLKIQADADSIHKELDSLKPSRSRWIN